MSDTAIVLLAAISATALVLSLLNYFEARDLHRHTMLLYGHVERIDRELQDAPLDPDVWETETD